MSPGLLAAQGPSGRISEIAANCADRLAASASADPYMAGSPSALKLPRNGASCRRRPAYRRRTARSDEHCDTAPPVKVLLVRALPKPAHAGARPYERAPAESGRWLTEVKI